MVYTIFQHKDTGYRIAFEGVGGNKVKRAENRRRRRLKAAMDLIPFSSFLTLTYRDECLPESSEHIRVCLNRMKAYYRKFLDSSFSYVWVIEYGALLGRPHFHVLTTIPYLTPVLHEKLEDWWGQGFVKVKHVMNVQHGVRYISKYMCKVVPMAEVRRYGTSRDIPATPKSRWDYIGICADREVEELVDRYNVRIYEATVEAYIR